MSSPDYEQQNGYIRSLYRYLRGAGDSKVYAQYFSLAPATAMGHFETTVGTSPVTLPNLPQYVRRVVICSLTENLTFTDDGTTPSGTHGMVIPKGVVFTYDTDPPANFKMWCPSASDVRVAYYG